MKSLQGILVGLFMMGLAGASEAQVTVSTENQKPAAVPAVAFPPTPTPAAPEKPLDQAGLDEHLVPSQFLGRTSDVLALVYNGFRRSQVDPCGCVTHQLGGLPKEATLVKRIEELKIPNLGVDAGGFVRDMPDEKMLSNSKFLLKGLAKLGYDAVNVGFTDLALGVDELKKLGQETGLSLLSANIQDGSGKLLFEPYVVKNVTLANGKALRVGIIGVTRPRVEVAMGATTATMAATPAPAAGATGSDAVTVTDPIAAINKFAAEVGQKSDFVVVLDYDRRNNADAIIDGIKGSGVVDVLVMGENAQIQGSAQSKDGVLVVSGGYEGRQLGTLYVELKDNQVASNWNKHIEVIQTIPSDGDIDGLVKEAHEAGAPAGVTTGANGPATTGPAKLNLN